MVLSSPRELGAFSIVLALIVGGFFADSLFSVRVLSPADVLFASRSFREAADATYEPANRLLIDPVLQFQPWIEFNRSMIRAGRLPLWNSSSGCGVPHLANGQAAVFDPFQVIAYLGELPQAHAWMAASRLWFAGLGMFLLARAWSLGPWGRWFCGLAFPFCGFLVVWLLFPVTNVAVWLPWVLLATESVWERPGPRSVGWLSLAIGGCLVGGHVQTSAHVLLLAGTYSGWRAWRVGSWNRALTAWMLGVTLGVGVAAVEIIPLGVYLTKSPVWGDREREKSPPWTMARPRVLDAFCTALPYLYGSQRRGQPNLAKAIGVHNLNESAGGFAGLATLIWLAPLAWSSRWVQPRVRFLAALTIFGFLGAFRLPPVDNLLRCLPVLGVTDNRRLTLWVAFGLVVLGGIGLDRLWAVRERVAWERWAWGWVAASIALLAAAGGLERFAPTIRAKAVAHYAKAVEATPGAESEVFQARADRQVSEMLDFMPRYLGLAAAQGLILAGLLRAYRRGSIGSQTTQAVLLGLTMVDLLGFGHGLNPAIPRGDDRPLTPVILALRREVGRSGRIIGLGAELPPNSLMRYGLADARNYDSVELNRSLDWLAPLYDPKVREKTSRREITWERVQQARERLREASVRAIVSPTPPPSDGFERVEQVGSVWVAWLDARPLMELVGEGTLTKALNDPGRAEATIEARGPVTWIFRETFDLGWRAQVDGVATSVKAHLGTFLAVDVPPGSHQVVLVYDPTEVRIGLTVSLIAMFGAVFALTEFGPFRFTRIVRSRLGRIRANGLESNP